jgi:hypothetical protein
MLNAFPRCNAPRVWSRTPRRISSPIGKPFSEERTRQADPFVGARLGHGRVAGSSRNASRIYHRRRRESVDDAHVAPRTGGTVDFRGFDFAVDSLTEVQMSTVGPKSGVKFTVFVQICPKIGVGSRNSCSSLPVFRKVGSALQWF